MPEIVPVELTLPSGRWYTLYQRGWDDADDDSLAFLGRGHRVFAFPTPDELAAWAGAHHNHHLGVSVLWDAVRGRFLSQFEPADADRYDLVAAGYDRAASAATRELVADLLHQLGIDLSADPVSDLLPRGGSLTGLPVDAEQGPARVKDVPWEWVLAQVEAGVGWPDDTAADPAYVPHEHALPLESVAPGVEALWLGLGGVGALTLVHRAEDDEVDFLGNGTTLLAAGTAEALSAYVESAPLRSLPSWARALREGADDLDYEPYEDNVVDLDELGSLIGPDVDREGAQTLLAAWPLVEDLAAWLGLEQVHAAFDESCPLGRFFVRDLLDLSSGSLHVRGRLAETDLTAARDQWARCVDALAAKVSWVDEPEVS